MSVPFADLDTLLRAVRHVETVASRLDDTRHAASQGRIKELLAMLIRFVTSPLRQRVVTCPTEIKRWQEDFDIPIRRPCKLFQTALHQACLTACVLLLQENAEETKSDATIQHAVAALTRIARELDTIIGA